ncbi:MAG: hypothetical protein MZV70_26165 [Desulfobacterales bacterium]|nr:hypothetical protein [Desulfobacterales bacterium]
MQEGDQGVIHSIEGGSALTSRLAGMGIVTECQIPYRSGQRRPDRYSSSRTHELRWDRAKRQK